MFGIHSAHLAVVLLLRHVAVKPLKMVLLIQHRTVEAVRCRLAVGHPFTAWLKRHDDQNIKSLDIEQGLPTEALWRVPLEV